MARVHGDGSPGVRCLLARLLPLVLRVELRLLVVDDEESILFALKEYFTARGFEVDCAQDVAAAKDLLSRNRYAVVIADVRLGGIDEHQGLHLVRCLRRRWPRVRVIVITAYGSPAIEAEARRLEVGAFLEKPVRLSALREIVETLARQASGAGSLTLSLTRPPLRPHASPIAPRPPVSAGEGEDGR